MKLTEDQKNLICDHAILDRMVQIKTELLRETQQLKKLGINLPDLNLSDSELRSRAIESILEESN